MATKLILTGFMATGKSVVARALARRLHWRLIDSDSIIVARAGKSIPEIFSEHGEAHFRELELEVVEVIARDRHRCPQCGEPRPAVISTGGGVLVDPRNHVMLQRAGLIICLSARPEVIARRIGSAATGRPILMQGSKPLNERIAELMEERREAYARAAMTVDTSDYTVAEVVDTILSKVAAYRSKRWAAFA